MQITLTFDQQGIGHGLYTELIPLQQIGTLQMARASSIEFNPTSQQWEVRDTADNLLYADPSRCLCLQWESEHFNR
jgi:hypothetical protein